MPQAEKRVTCPGCAHEFSVPPDADSAHLVCPHCEAEFTEQAVRGLSEVVEDLALGFKPGQQLGSYVIEALLGSGGMAVVFRGRQLSLNRNVAIKILSERPLQKQTLRPAVLERSRGARQPESPEYRQRH